MKQILPTITSIYQWCAIIGMGIFMVSTSPKIVITIGVCLMVVAMLILHRLWLVSCRVFISEKIMAAYKLHPALEYSKIDSHNLSYYSNFTPEIYRIYKQLRKRYPIADEDVVFDACYSVFMGNYADYWVHFNIRLNRAIDLYQAIGDYLDTKTFCSYWTYKRIVSDKYLIKVGG